MRVLLVEPPSTGVSEYSISSRENLGLGYLTASLRGQGYAVEEISCPALNWDADDMLSHAKKFGPDVVGVSLPFTDELAGTFGPLRALSTELGPGVPMMAGGHAATAAAGTILAEVSGIAAVIRGEGELTLLDIVRRIQQNADICSVQGLTIRGQDGIYQTPDRALIGDLDCLAFPARDTLKSKRAQGRMPDEVYITSSRGCPYRCSFCDIKSFYKTGKGLSWRGRSPDNIVAELRMLLTEFGPECVYLFVDDQFIGPGKAGQERAKSIGREIINARLELSFEITCRADTLTRDTLLLLKQAGLSGVYLGLDSGSQAVLNRFQKDTTVESNLDAMKLLCDMAIPVDFGFIMFEPWMTIEDLRNNLAFLKSIAVLGVPIHESMFTNCLKLYPNTPIAERAAREFTDDRRSSSVQSTLAEVLYEHLGDSIRTLGKQSDERSLTVADLDKIEIMISSLLPSDRRETVTR